MADGKEPSEKPRAFRGLILVFALSFLSLVGVMLTVTALGGAEPWSTWQFIGLFGAIEAASGLGNVIVPNIWRLPVAEVQTKRTTRIRLAASTLLLIPHWGGLARAAAGVVLVVAAGVAEGFGPASLLLPVIMVLFAALLVGLSMILARAGVARPDLDVIQFIVRRPTGDTEVPPISIGASFLQLLLGIATIPMAKAFSPSIFYRPEIGPSPEALAVTVAVTLVVGAGVVACWWGRIEWEAPRDQQREAEKFA
ncbi:MAG: hypothetical protein GEU28_14140 [Dehalococcoidia bacterium]|nr:hypothetical protein [Dehalococcoidia bacterium]